MNESIKAPVPEFVEQVTKTAGELIVDAKNEFLGNTAQHFANMIMKYCPHNDLRHAAIANLQMAFDFANKALQAIDPPPVSEKQ